MVSIYEVLTALLIVLAIMAILWWTIFRITKSLQKSALIVAVFFILFFSFGHVLPAIGNVILKIGVDIRSQLMYEITLKLYLLLILWIVVFLVFLFLINRVQSDMTLTSTFMNVTSIALLILIVFQSTQDFLILEKPIQKMVNDSINASVLDNQDPIQQTNPSEGEKPNIYYIILDGYGRNDIFNKYYEFDNKELLTYLMDNGFYIADESHSNYAHTALSLSSSLNMQYLDYVADQLGRTSNNPFPVIQLIQNSRLEKYLSDQDYTTVGFETGYGSTELKSADKYFSPGKTLTTFQSELINLTPLRIWLHDFLYDTHRRRILYTFNHLPTAIQSSQPTFVFAHITSPHTPFVFGPNGEKDHPDMEYSIRGPNAFTELAGQDEYIRRYRNQVIYLNILLRAAIDQILSQNGGNAVIVIQADHGPGSMLDWGSVENTNIEERMSILNAYYFPDQDYSNLYPGITPVNSFRVILDQYLGTDLGKLEDRSFFSLMATWYDLIEVEFKPNH
ncbi:hypothetical protein ACFLY4_10575 [Chloroflexota bacterium]